MYMRYSQMLEVEVVNLQKGQVVAGVGVARLRGEARCIFEELLVVGSVMAVAVTGRRRVRERAFARARATRQGHRRQVASLFALLPRQLHRDFKRAGRVERPLAAVSRLQLRRNDVRPISLCTYM